MNTTCVILNPGSRTGGDEDVLERLERLLGDWEVRRTEHAGHAGELARAAAAEGFETVVAAGGDGTVNEVVNGLAAAAAAGEGRACLGILPLGTGNDLVRLLGIPADLEEAVAALRLGACRRLDLGEMRTGDESRFFLNVAAGGFSGEVDKALTPEIKRSWGPLAYLRAATEVLRDLEVYRVRIRFDGDETVELAALNVVVANGRFAGGGVPIAPRAHPCDGLLEVVVIPEMPLTSMVALAPRVLAGRHLDIAEEREAEEREAEERERERAGSDADSGTPDSGAASAPDAEPPRLIYRRCRTVELESEPPMPWNNDGELIGELSPSFRLLPQALSVVVGAEPLWEADEPKDGAQDGAEVTGDPLARLAPPLEIAP